ncbi:MAG: 30S ribosomal protein S18 [Candidatus Parcubacteria bacterium]|nr:30S ribosomal protein S18 [Patescibacteria group bacterium]BCX16300.1 MAG: 30S ribosomal protein S18 [Candidatus Parcubacteria bacterium]
MNNKKQCFFCFQNIKEIDYKDPNLLKKFISSQGKIIDPQHTGTCPRHQRRLAQAIKRARFLGLLSYVKK